MCRVQHQGSARGSLGPEEVRAPSLSLLSAAMESSSPLMRCLAAEGLARLVQVVGDPGFSVSASLLCFDRCRQSLLLDSTSARTTLINAYMIYEYMDDYKIM